MKKIVKRSLSLMLSLTLLGSLAACGSTPPAATSAPASSSAAATASVYDRGVEGQAPVDDNYWTKWVQTEFGDRHNVTVQYVAIPRSDEVNKFNMLLAAGDAPDIIYHYDYPAAIA